MIDDQNARYIINEKGEIVRGEEITESVMSNSVIFGSDKEHFDIPRFEPPAEDEKNTIVQMNLYSSEPKQSLGKEDISGKVNSKFKSLSETAPKETPMETQVDIQKMLEEQEMMKRAAEETKISKLL